MTAPVGRLPTISTAPLHAPHESDLLAAIMRELMDDGQPATNKAVIARVITRLEVEGDEQRLQSYRNLLAQLKPGAAK